MAKELGPQMAELLRLADEAGTPPLHSLPYAQARDFYVLTSKKLAGEPPGGLDVSDFTIKSSTAPFRLGFIGHLSLMPGKPSRSWSICMVAAGVLAIWTVTIMSVAGWPRILIVS